MIDLNIKKSAPKKQNIKPGDFSSVVKSVGWANGYREGDAFDVCYTLTDKSGKQFEYKELFYCTEQNTRTADFFNYLTENGIESIDKFVGCKENLTLLKRVKDNKTFLSITRREFLSTGDAEGEP